MRYNKERVDYLLTQPKTEQVVNELLRLNYGLLVEQLKRFYLYDDPDALSLGYEVLHKAITTYDPKNTTKFSTYATVCIYNRLGSHIRSLNTQSNIDTISYHATNDQGIAYVDILESDLTADGGHELQCRMTVLERAIMLSYKELRNQNHINIIRSWVASDFTETQDNLAKKHRCSQVYVVQIIKKFRGMIKTKMEELQ
jgi:DNA-directed RNA polymerase specialized sigma subunit